MDRRKFLGSIVATAVSPQLLADEPMSEVEYWEWKLEQSVRSGKGVPHGFPNRLIDEINERARRGLGKWAIVVN
jgi:hypothetical protein